MIPETVLRTLSAPDLQPREAREPIECRAVVGTASLWLSEIASLGEDDAVVLDHALYGRAILEPLGPTPHAWQCAISNGDLLITNPSEKDPMTSTHGQRATHDDAPDTALDVSLRHTQDVPVTLTAEVARFSIPYVDLASLKIGDVVKTGREVSDEVVLRAGARAVASGRLIEFDGALAVQITKLHTAGA